MNHKNYIYPGPISTTVLAPMVNGIDVSLLSRKTSGSAFDLLNLITITAQSKTKNLYYFYLLEFLFLSLKFPYQYIQEVK